MKIEGKGVIIVDVNGTINYFNYKNNKELVNLMTRFNKTQGLSDITIVDCEDKEILFDDDFEKKYCEIL